MIAMPAAASSEPGADVDGHHEQDHRQGRDARAGRTQRHELPEIAARGHRQRRDRAARDHEEERPAVEKGEEPPEAVAHVDVQPARLRLHRAQLAVCERTQQRQHAGDHPHGEREHRLAAGLPKHGRRHDEDARADHRGRACAACAPASPSSAPPGGRGRGSSMRMEQEVVVYGSRQRGHGHSSVGISARPGARALGNQRVSGCLRRTMALTRPNGISARPAARAVRSGPRSGPRPRARPAPARPSGRRPSRRRPWSIPAARRRAPSTGRSATGHRAA